MLARGKRESRAAEDPGSANGQVKPACARLRARAERKQLQYLRQLAQRTGTTFAMPSDIDEASAEITRLLKLTPTSRADQTREKRAVQRDLAERIGVHPARAAQWVRAAGATYDDYVTLRTS